jgi:uncharacterized membrane protein YhaH (DUF805 family)
MLFHIFQGIGIAAAVGIRPFLPALLVGALAAGDVEINFNGSGLHFLQTPPFLIAMAVLAIGLAVLERRLTAARLERRESVAALGLAAVVLGALLFGGAVARGHHAAWPGYIGGVLCALVGLAAIAPLFARVRRRLDDAAAMALPVYREAIALLVALLSVVAAPLGLLALLLLLWLLFASRRRGEQKYAGLRILR